MSSKNTIEPNVICTMIVDTSNIVKYCVTDKEDNLLSIKQVVGYATPFKIRQKIVQDLRDIHLKYGIDTLLLQKTKLFTDGITTYPDWMTYNNVLLNYSIETTVDDNFHNIINNILVIPPNEWARLVLNNSQLKSFDAYKKHITNQQFKYTEEQFEIFHQFNFYKLLCFSESVHYENLMNTKYLLNKEKETDVNEEE